MGVINFLIVKMLVKVNHANIINIAAKKEIIPELLQFKCNAKNIYEHVSFLLESPEKMKYQVLKTQNIINTLKTDKSSAEIASQSLINFLKK